MNGSEGDNNDQDKEENVELFVKMIEEEVILLVFYYGKILVVFEYMKFFFFEEIFLVGEEVEKDFF